MYYRFDFPLTRFLFVLFICFILFGCSDEPQEKDWTILVYMAADNGLNDAALADIIEMQAAEFSDDINVIVQVDYSEFNEITGAYRYHIYPDEKKLIDYLGEINSGDWHSITDFANWGFDKYPADKNALVLWSHGNGWYPANRLLYPCFCPDEESQDSISISSGDLNNAIKQINTHLNFLVFDACNMQTMEVITEIYPYVDYIIAAEDAVNTLGFPYHTIFSIWEDYTQVQILAEEIAFYFHEFYWSGDLYPISCSVVKSSLFQDLLADVSEFSERWSANAADSIFHLSRQDCLEFNGSWISSPADVDIKEFFLSILEHEPPDSLAEFCDRIVANINNCFIFQKTDEYPTGYPTDKVGAGIIWFPDVDTYYYFGERLDEYNQLDFSDTGWQNFLANTFE